MRSSNLINESSVSRALRDILQGLEDANVLRPFLTTFEDLKAPRVTHEFPAFNMLARGRKFPPYKWFLPKPKVSILEFLRVYEQFALAVRGGVDNPAEVAAKIYPRGSDAGRLVLHHKDESQWLSAGHTMIIAALWLGAEVEAYEPDGTLRARLGDGLLDVSPAGVYSNTDRETFKPRVESEVYSWPVLPFPATKSDNPLLTAFWEHHEELEPSLMLAASLISLAIKEEVVGRAFLRSEIKSWAPKVLATSKRTPEKLEAATAALQKCTELLDNVDEGLLQALHEAAVPGLMLSAKFRSAIGNSSHSPSTRVVAAATRAKWREAFEQAYGDLHSAVL